MMRLRSIIEGFAVLLVILLTGLLIGLIVQYVKLTQKESAFKDQYALTQAIESKKESIDSYVKALEGYEERDTAPSTSDNKEVNVAETSIEVPNDDITNAIDQIVQSALEN